MSKAFLPTAEIEYEEYSYNPATDDAEAVLLEGGDPPARQRVHGWEKDYSAKLFKQANKGYPLIDYVLIGLVILFAVLFFVGVVADVIKALV